MINPQGDVGVVRATSDDMAPEGYVIFQVPTHQTASFNCLDLYHKSPDSGEPQCKSRS